MKVAAIGIVITAALAVAIVHHNSLDPNCPYCDIDNLNKHGGTLEYTDGSEDKIFVLKAGYHKAENTKSDASPYIMRRSTANGDTSITAKSRMSPSTEVRT